jgi:hypothetical protein
MKILLTANDLGSARQNLSFAESCVLKNFDVIFKFLAMGPARDVFQNSSILEVDFDYKSFNHEKFAEQNVKKILEDFQPDFVLAGLSFKGESIDELVRKITKEKDLPFGVIQDYWGYLGAYDLNSLPDVFFVFDKEASRLTDYKTDGQANCIITGSPKHEIYKEKITGWLDEQPLKSLNEKNIVFIGQPSEIGGIFENFKIFLNAANQLKGSFKIYFKPHPSDMAYLSQYEEALKIQIQPYEIIENNIEIETILCQADIIITCFSTSGIDHNYLQFYANKPLGELVYLTSGNELLNSIEKLVGIAEIPGAKSGMGEVCKSQKELQITLQNFLLGYPSEYSKKVKDCLGMKNSPTQTIFNYIKALI